MWTFVSLLFCFAICSHDPGIDVLHSLAANNHLISMVTRRVISCHELVALFHPFPCGFREGLAINMV